MINFPPELSEEERLKICKMLEEKDKEIKQLYKDIIVLENKLESYNGALTWRESENFKTQVAINNGILEQVRAGLKKYNLRYVECKDPKSPHAFPIKIERISMLERFSTWLRSLINFKIVRNNN